MAAAESDRTTALIYSALLGETGWQSVLDEVVAATDVDMATLFYHDALGGRGAITLAAGIPESVQRDYSSHFAPLNPWMSLVSSTPIGEGVVGEQVVSRDRFTRTEYYNDFLKPYEQESGVGVTVRNDGGCFFLLSVLSGDTDFERNSGRARFLTSIAPHLRRASDYYLRQVASSFGGLAAGLGEVTGIATIVVNPAARVIYASPPGERLLAQGDTVGVDAAGIVSFRDSMAQSVFAHALYGQYTDLLSKTVATAGAEINFVRVTEDVGSTIFMGGSLAILIVERDNAASSGAERIAAAYGLTPAEKRVLEGIVSGKRPAEIAAAASVSVETVRSQLKAIYGKTGADRQPALVRLAAGLTDSSNGVHAGSRKR